MDERERERERERKGEQADETDGGRENYCKVRMMLLEGRSSGSFKCDRPE